MHPRGEKKLGRGAEFIGLVVSARLRARVHSLLGAAVGGGACGV